jgi:hypothetical protein
LARLRVLDDLPIIFHNLTFQLKVSSTPAAHGPQKKAACREFRQAASIRTYLFLATT